MKDYDDNIREQIDLYLKGKLSLAERTAFEAQLSQDDQLMLVLEKQRVIHLLLMEAGLNDLRQMMKNDLVPKKGSNKNKWIGGGLFVLMLVGAGAVMTFNSRPERISEYKENPSASVITNDAHFEKKENSTKVEEKSKINTSPTAETAKDVREETNTEGDNSTEKAVKKEITPIPYSVGNDADPKLTENPVEANEAKPCLNYEPKISISTQPSLMHQQTGKIIVAAKESGLRYTLNNKINPYRNTFEDLAPGVYELEVENAIGCQWKEQNIKVGSTYCLVLNEETFNLSAGNNYKLPSISEGVSGVHIYDKRMQEIRILNPSDSQEWDGRNKEGQQVETGLYKIEVRYSNGERCFFNLTIFN